MKLFVGNIPFASSESEMRDLFSEKYTSLTSFKLIMDRETGRSRGFGFAEFSSQEEAEQAVAELNGYNFNGKELVVNEARPQEKRTDRGRPFKNNRY
ncbi:MAG: RNA-binding protein [Chlamydiae bacterium CG10_big_fil_rev_8_21_14_0_10_35_9]|nr:MAG: RNA-binding protein [Chlamydiae bacterium CG10_big_fil_rev_8_21_14_0_10_35_9]